MAWWAIFSQTQGYIGPTFIIMAVVGNFNFFYFLRLTWEFLALESERGGSVCWPNNNIITRRIAHAFARLVLKIQKFACRCILT